LANRDGTRESVDVLGQVPLERRLIELVRWTNVGNLNAGVFNHCDRLHKHSMWRCKGCGDVAMWQCGDVMMLM
jgi:hypothetical protein